jgi:hypothetical protein
MLKKIHVKQWMGAAQLMFGLVELEYRYRFSIEMDMGGGGLSGNPYFFLHTLSRLWLGYILKLSILGFWKCIKKKCWCRSLKYGSASASYMWSANLVMDFGLALVYLWPS